MLLIDNNLLFQNIYFGRNIHKAALFLLKNCKNAGGFVSRTLALPNFPH